MDISIPYSHGAYSHGDHRNWTWVDNWTRINEEDRLALESLEWGTTEGSIRINDDGRVQKLKFPFPSLKPTICRLKALEELDLLCCRSLNSLPEEIGALHNLKILNLSHTSIRSYSPWIGRLVSLEELHLEEAENLKSLPEEMKNLKKLKVARMAYSYVPKLPSWIGQWVELQELNLHHTFLTELPDEIGNLRNLVTLDLGATEIKSLPSSIGRLKSLERLFLINCWNLERLPEAMGDLRKLNVLNSYGTDIANKPSIEYALACHRYKSRITTSPTGNVWALILAHAKHAFRACKVDVNPWYYFNLRFMELPEETGELRGLEEHDAIFRILVDHRTSFVETLTNRKKRKRIGPG